MKITIELEAFAVKVLGVLSLAAWCAWGDQADVAMTVYAFVSALKP